MHGSIVQFISEYQIKDQRFLSPVSFRQWQYHFTIFLSSVLWSDLLLLTANILCLSTQLRQATDPYTMGDHCQLRSLLGQLYAGIYGGSAMKHKRLPQILYLCTAWTW